MSEIFKGRYTADAQGDFVVFLIGMRVNKLLSVRKWMPVASAMGPMLQALYQHPDKGFLGGQTFVSWRTILMVQYWRSFEDLEKFARNADDPHLSAWRKFNQAIGSDGTVGIFHETYRVGAGQHETVYVNMPRTGMPAAMGHVPVSRQRNNARDRMNERPMEPAHA